MLLTYILVRFPLSPERLSNSLLTHYHSPLDASSFCEQLIGVLSSDSHPSWSHVPAILLEAASQQPLREGGSISIYFMDVGAALDNHGALRGITGT